MTKAAVKGAKGMSRELIMTLLARGGVQRNPGPGHAPHVPFQTLLSTAAVSSGSKPPHVVPGQTFDLG